MDAFNGGNGTTKYIINNTIFVNTPLTADAPGNIYFGFRVQGTANEEALLEVVRLLVRTGQDINLANLYMKAGRLDDATTEYKQVLRYDPGNLGPQLESGQLLAMKGDYDSALALLTRLVKEHPDSSEAETGLGIVLYQKKDPAAREHFKKALAMKPDSVNAAYRGCPGFEAAAVRVLADNQLLDEAWSSIKQHALEEIAIRWLEEHDIP